MRAGGYVIGAGVHIYIYMFEVQKKLNRTLAIDSPFQTFTVGLLVEFIELTLELALERSVAICRPDNK